jgi:LacI family transcriptional regulator
MLYNQKIGIKEIAQAAGVSSSTVSRVLRGRGEIAPETRNRIQRIARNLGYRPNLAVRTMQTGRSQIVGILMEITADPDFRGKILTGIHNTLIAANHLPVVIWPQESVEGFSETDQIHRLVDHRVDALIMSLENVKEDFIKYIDNLSIPVVILDRYVSGIHRDVVVTDNRKGGETAAMHLANLGHKRISLVTDSEFCSAEPTDRAGAFLRTLKKKPDIQLDSVKISERNRGYTESLDMLTRQKRPTAIFAFNDYIAWNVRRAAEKIGLAVPGDLSIIGFGNLPHIIELFPALTTFEQEPLKIGQLAAELVLRRVWDEEDVNPTIHYIEPVLINRGSTGPPGK